MILNRLKGGSYAIAQSTVRNSCLIGFVGIVLYPDA